MLLKIIHKGYNDKDGDDGNNNIKKNGGKKKINKKYFELNVAWPGRWGSRRLCICIRCAGVIIGVVYKYWRCLHMS